MGRRGGGDTHDHKENVEPNESDSCAEQKEVCFDTSKTSKIQLKDLFTYFALSFEAGDSLASFVSKTSHGQSLTCIFKKALH